MVKKANIPSPQSQKPPCSLHTLQLHWENKRKIIKIMWKLRVTYETAREDELGAKVRQGASLACCVVQGETEAANETEWVNWGGRRRWLGRRRCWRRRRGGDESERTEEGGARRSTRNRSSKRERVNWGGRRRCLVDSAVNGGEGEAMRVSEQWTTALESEWTVNNEIRFQREGGKIRRKGIIF